MFIVADVDGEKEKRFFFYKQKTAYEIYQCDWSSDVCSSDLETFKQAMVVVAAQEDGKRIGRIRMRRIPDASAASLLPFVASVVEPGSVIHTDGWPGYAGLEEKGYVHEVTVLTRSKASASDLLPRVHRVVSLLKRWILGDRKSTRLNSSHTDISRMPSSA